MPRLFSINFNLFLSVFLALLLLNKTSSHKVSKCCPLGQLLSARGCVSMKSGTALPKIRVGGSLVSFKWLKDQKMLKIGSTPKCDKQEGVFPDFTEMATSKENMPHFSEDGVFIHELRYYRPAAYCVDGQLDTEAYDVEEEIGRRGEQPSYIKVVVCEEKWESMRTCHADDKDCHHRCCDPWQTLRDDQCMMTKAREKTNLTSSLGTNKPDCEARMLGPGQFRLGSGGLVVLGTRGAVERIVEKERYCVDRRRVRVCNDTLGHGTEKYGDDVLDSGDTVLNSVLDSSALYLIVLSLIVLLCT